MSRLSRWLIAGVLGVLCSTGSGCRTSTPTPRPNLPPPVPLADGSQSYQVGPDHPLVQQAAAIRAAANAQTR
ncbi:hypothetical protein [Roseimaritima ulvae]|uniref:Uncharacterized protein n=1 Tax=Roseimaritima ulvae TaxID=980254 RepID=A0A5B9QTB2_9BACT|nr:hypothetical protein [Roseimaritima ulvae]QEG40645.1 hypothetical protein UC8_26620 [Roseimaritima ulvae]